MGNENVKLYFYFIHYIFLTEKKKQIWHEMYKVLVPKMDVRANGYFKLSDQLKIRAYSLNTQTGTSKFKDTIFQ